MLAAACGLEAPTKVQSSAWALAMNDEEGQEGGEGKEKGEKKKEDRNRNLLIVAPPGAGKTLAYLLPAAAKVVVESEEEEDGSGDDDDDDDGDDDGDAKRRRKRAKRASSSHPISLLPSPRVLVLVPTRELARQVAAAARPLRRAAGLKVVRVAGGDRREDQVDRLRASAAGKNGSKSSSSSSVHVLVATPGRLLDLVRGGDVGLGELSVFFFSDLGPVLRELDPTPSPLFSLPRADLASLEMRAFSPLPHSLPTARPRD